MSQASATFPVSLSSTHLPIPPKPHLQDFQFKIIGKEPALLMRLSNNMSTQLDDLDMDDIYEELPLPSSSSVATEIVTCSRPTLFQTLAGEDELGLTDTNHPSTSTKIVDSLSMPPSLQSISSIGAPDIPKFLPNTTSPLPTSPYRLWTSSVSPDPVPQSTTCAVGSPTNLQRPNRTLSSHQSPIDLALPPSDQDLRPVDSSIALKKVVVLKDKFRAVSATARQSQRLAKHALMNAQRSAAAAQTCLAAAESFVPCVGDVISAIRRMRPGSVACGSASEWTAVLRDLEDDLYDLKQWSCLDTFGRALGQNLPLLQNIHLDGTTRESSIGFPLTSVEEEAQEAVRAWNQLDRQIQEKECPSDRGRLRREPGSQSDDRVSPESHIHRVRRLGMEDGAENFQHQVIRESGTRVSKEISTGNLDKVRQGELSQAGGRQSVEAEPRREVEGNLPVEIATVDAKDCRERQDPRDHHLHAQQQPAQSCEKVHHGPESRDEGSARVSMAASGDIASKKTPADGLQPQSTSSRRDTPIGVGSLPQENPSMHDRTPRNLQTSLALPIITEQSPTSKPVSSDSMRAENRPIRPPSLSSALPHEISAAPRNVVDPTESTSASQANPPTPISTTFSDSEAVARSCGGLDKTLVPRLGSQTSDRLRDVSCSSPIKTECVEPQLNFGVDGSRVVNDPLVPNEVKPALNNPLKPDLDTFANSVPLNSSPDECEIGMKSPGRVSSVNLSAPLPNGPPARNQKLPEAHISPSTGPATSDSVKVIATPPHHHVSNNDIPAQPVLSNSHASPSSQLSPTSAVVPVHSPISPSAVPLALRVETPTSYPNRDFDDSISPDLMFSHGWIVDGPRRGLGNKSVPRSQSRDVESLNQYVHHGSRPVASHPRSHMPGLGSRLSKSPDGRRPMPPYEYSTPLIGKKRPRDEVNHPLPPRSRRDWTGAAFPSVSENQMSHVSQADMSANPRLGPLTTPIPEPRYNSNNSSHHPAPSLINRLDPSSESRAQVAHPVERRIQQQPPTQHRAWQSGGYNVGQAPSGHRSNQSYDSGTPKLLNRMRSQEFQHGFDSGHSPNVGRTSNRSHGRGRSFGGQSVALQQQQQQQHHSSRKQLSLYDRINPEH